MSANKLGGQAAVVGVGETDYPVDYRRSRGGRDGVRRDSYSYAVQAFKRALEDANLTRDDIDGLVVGPPLAYERTSEILGLNPRWGTTGDHAQSVFLATMAIATGAAECVALIYGNDQRTAKSAYGGPNSVGSANFLSYSYFAQWGLTSPGALYAMMTSSYRSRYGMSERALAEVSVRQRQFAAGNPNAIMTEPITVDDYLESKYIVEPLHLYDYCLINDGGVCLIVTTREKARSLGVDPVVIEGIGRADENIDAASLRPRIESFYHNGHDRVAEQVYTAAGVGPEDISVVQIYDSFSIHIPVALEGFGFFPEGDAEKFLLDGGLRHGGRVAVNTFGGHLSGSYMQGWAHQVEAVRQVRGVATGRQQPDTRRVQFISDVAGKVASVIYGQDS